uniref:Oligopeptide transporter 1 n=1 Tax=Lutzomyia longipalpis TaxID=7200 RepID=A0A7G3AMI3_LUTLO
MNFPRSVIFILLNEFAERFAFYGMKTILVLYLRSKLNFNDDTSTEIFHIFVSLVYFFPLIGAIVADSWLGKYKTIFFLSIVYAIGSVVISLGAIPPLNLPVHAMTILGMLLIATGTGGIKPCVASFGGDQFKLPEQAASLAKFFSLFYFTINAGSFISTLLTPALREDVHCFGQMDCYSLAFGVPAVLMIVSIVIFVLGRSLYTVTKPTGNMIVLVSKCIGNAIASWSKEKKVNPRSHWLEYAEPKYGKTLVKDVKILLKILVLYLPLPFFWALFDQQSSRWTFQATRMDGRVGPITIKPDQMQVINPLLILAFIPLFDVFVYPLLGKVGIRRPLQKLTLGGILAAIAFTISGLIELKLESLHEPTPSIGYTQIRIYNPLPCQYKFKLADHITETLHPQGVFLSGHISLDSNATWQGSAELSSGSATTNCPASLAFNVNPVEEQVLGLSLFAHQNGELQYAQYEDSPTKSKFGIPVVRFLMNFNDTLILVNNESSTDIHIKNFDRIDVPEGQWTIKNNDTDAVIGEISVGTGGVYTYLLTKGENDVINLKEEILSPENSVHMLWQIPQYVVMTAGEVMFSVTGLEFSYSQAPVSMKSVLQACWLLTVAIGNVIVVALTHLKFFESQAAEFFEFAVLMLIDMGIFILIAMRYKYVQHDDANEGNEGDKPIESSIQMEQKPDKEGIANKAYNED